jgi:hypothetical protein
MDESMGYYNPNPAQAGFLRKPPFREVCLSSAPGFSRGLRIVFSKDPGQMGEIWDFWRVFPSEKSGEMNFSV